MKKKIITLTSLFVWLGVFAQVGINTSSPEATLEIKGKSGVTDKDGVIPPKLTRAQLTAKGNTLYSAAQDGALIYVTDVTGGDNTSQRIRITSPGLYYFNYPLNQWLRVSNVNTESDWKEADLQFNFRQSANQLPAAYITSAVSLLPENLYEVLQSNITLLVPSGKSANFVNVIWSTWTELSTNPTGNFVDTSRVNQSLSLIFYAKVQEIDANNNLVGTPSYSILTMQTIYGAAQTSTTRTQVAPIFESTTLTPGKRYRISLVYGGVDKSANINSVFNWGVRVTGNSYYKD